MEMNWEEKTNRALEKVGVSLAQYYIMGTVDYRMWLPIEKLARNTAQLVEGDSRGNFSHAEYLEAINQCFERKWLELVTPEFYATEVKRQRSPVVPELFDTSFVVGDVKFTKHGYEVYQQVRREIYGKEEVESGFNLNVERCELEVLAATAATCKEGIQELLMSPSDYVGEEIEITMVSEPEEIGPWKPNPFLTVPRGFRARLTYKTCRLKSSS